MIIVNAIILSLVPISIGDPVMVQKKPTILTVLKTLKIVGLLVKQCFSLQYISWNQICIMSYCIIPLFIWFQFKLRILSLLIHDFIFKKTDGFYRLLPFVTK